MEKKQEPKTPEVSEKKNTEKKEDELMHSFSEKMPVSASPMKVVAVFVVVAFLGIGTGFGLSQLAKATGTQLIPVASVDPTLTGKTFGSEDLETFKDVAEGKLEEGGIEGEGQFHLVRPGGESQNVYLTSSLVDLSQFVGRKIKVWGQTQAAQHAGWLMDVGRVEVQ
ncbi:MAG TPA: hypothetical protein VLF20_03770 [Patescibacteria group bacterium]|nr:hypothetical protein [Patescibacteria group bacterium]